MTIKQYKCLCCGNPFPAREADRKRGWARYCSKSCKAIKQEQKTGQYAAYKSQYDNEVLDGLEDGWDGHKNAF